ncbi:MAG: alpha-glucan family phosphorylase, partial [Hydrogenimonas sp.]|nr:alpha-glucan family phosphorylase [Hydrogenimonas sp.]
WHAEFQKDGVNSFTIHHADPSLPAEEIDRLDYMTMMQKLEDKIIPLYYDNEREWLTIAKNGMNDILSNFDSSRMVEEYYEKLYDFKG